MRIIILTQYFYPEMGAPQNRLLELALGLQKLNWEVEVVTAMPNYPTGKIFRKYNNRIYCRENTQGIVTHRYWMYPSNSSSTFPRVMSMLSFSSAAIFSFFKVRKFMPDYVLVESPPLTLAFTGWMLSKFLDSKLIMNVSDLWPLSAKELGAINEGYTYRWLLQLESFLYHRSHICTGQSQEIVDYVSRIKPKNTWLLRNGVDVTRFNNSTSVRTNRIVYAGLIGVAQGIDSICENINFNELGLEFHIYGSGGGVSQLNEFLKKNLNNGIKYCGVISRDEIPVILGQYDAMLVSLVKNIYGAVPSKIYEAMAAGLPIVFSGEGEGAQIVTQNNIGWISQPGDWSGLIQNLKTLINLSEDNLLNLKQKSRKVAVEKFYRKNQIAEFDNRLRDYHNRIE
jgi:glycosyltransferase involved in cell wall biosynthesis